MHRRLIHVAIAAICLLIVPPAVVLAQTATAQTEVDEAELWTAAERLQDDRFQVRQAAMEMLWQAGERARPMLEKAADSGDREASSRASAVLARFRFGLYADLDPEIARWINNFRFGNANEKRAVLEQLRETGDIARLVQLIRAEPREPERRELANMVAGNIQKYASKLPAHGADDQWDMLLSLGASNDDGMRHYAAFLVLSGRAEARVLELESLVATMAKPAEPLVPQRRPPRAARVTPQPENKSDLEPRRFLVWLHRARGDLAAAQRIAKAHRLVDMQQELAYEMRDWPEMERLLVERIQAAQNTTDLELLGFLAATQRLQGKKQEFKATVDRLNEVGNGSNGAAFYAAEALLINGVPKDGIALMTSTREDYGFRLLIRQGKFREAFELVKMGVTLESRENWLRAQTERALAASSARNNAFDLLIQALRAIHAVGFREEAKERLLALAPKVIKDKSRMERMATLCETALRWGDRETARDFAAEAIVGGRSAKALEAYFPSNSDIAVLAWRYLEVEVSDASKVDRLKRLEKLLQPKTKMTADESLDFAKRWRAARREGTNASVVAWEMGLAKIQHSHGHLDHAVATLKPLTTSDSAAAMRAAEWLIAAEDYAQAETALNELLAGQPNDPPALYLRGWVRKQLNREDEGQLDIEAAIRGPLGVSAERQRLAQTLVRNDLEEEATAEYRRLLAFGNFQEWYVNDAAKQIGNAINAEQQGEAADLWERLLFSGFKRDRWFTAVEGYLQLTHLVHKTRARALLKEGKIDEAFENILIAHRLTPEDISLAEDLTPELRKKGGEKEADRLYELVYQANQNIVTDFPQSAMHLNNIAWLSARCDRRMEEALQLAEKANSMRPDTPSFVDTLGEILFRLGRKDEAIKCAKRCIELAPENSFYRSQLKRFQGEDG